MTSLRFFFGAAFAAGLVALAACESSPDSPASASEPDVSPDAALTRKDARGEDPEDAGDGGVTGPVPSVAAADVCPDAAKKICAFLQTCVPDFMTGVWASASECEPRFRDNCLAAYPVDAEVRKDDADAYATCLGKLTCDNLHGPHWTVACQTPRLATTKSLGEQCRSDFECETSACTGSSTTCGTCVNRKKAGDACTDNAECPVGGICVEKCFVPAYLGDVCDQLHLCSSGLRCVTGKCEKAGAVGADCDSDNDCDITALIECNKTAGKCEKNTFLDPGDSCPAAFDPGPPMVCAKGSSCIRPQFEAGTCVTNAKVGEACGSDVRCEAFINCRNNQCVLPTYVACP
jgi:hypothetical protein